MNTYASLKTFLFFQMVVLKGAQSVIYLPLTGVLLEMNEIMKTCAVW